MSWPKVHDEFETVELLRQGWSISRFGDGEFKLIDHKDQCREPRNQKLARDLRDTLTKPHDRLLVAIPTMDPKGAKYESWQRHLKRFDELLQPRLPEYYSAFISRPDSAQWIRTSEYAHAFASVWRGKKVAIVCEADGSALRAVAPIAREYRYFECPSHGAYAASGEIMERIRGYAPEVAILSCGPAATVMARRLSRTGIQAIDFGSGGAFLAKLLRE
ncbi:MAG: DUF1792 domain-containing protein [Rhizorhabdus sp.]|uniref:GT-D fold domain-containing glycosyltransferase n=1 Tax=Rhizorhabdus sp. TaxID=1968843 RepID=UPI001B64ADE5|nr:GT-D fold domain-containing glycosyltransferase [Rhizorhabdus sp.]MBP8231743.1 DUF1792 domain-containing protein [Rhizorhabdus sp.]